MVLPILLRAFPTSSFNEVLPQLPVIAIILPNVLSLINEEDFDKNCKVFGTNNLFIAGSSVFPTSGHANPTFTIVALSLKLSKLLMKNS